MTGVLLITLSIAALILVFVGYCILNTMYIEAMEEYEQEEEQEEPADSIPNHPFKFMEWRLPIINRIVKAEFLYDMLVFTIIDRNKDEGVEVGWWENGEWFIVSNASDRHCETFRRLMVIIMKRYAARISRLQKYLSHKKK